MRRLILGTSQVHTITPLLQKGISMSLTNFEFLFIVEFRNMEVGCDLRTIIGEVACYKLRRYVPRNSRMWWCSLLVCKEYGCFCSFGDSDLGFLTMDELEHKLLENETLGMTNLSFGC